MLVHRAEGRINVQLTAADAQFSTQIVLSRVAQVGGSLFRRHETSLGVLTRPAGRCVDELCVTAPEDCSTDTKWDRVADVGRRVTSGDTAFVYQLY